AVPEQVNSHPTEGEHRQGNDTPWPAEAGATHSQRRTGLAGDRLVGPVLLHVCLPQRLLPHFLQRNRANGRPSSARSNAAPGRDAGTIGNAVARPGISKTARSLSLYCQYNFDGTGTMDATSRFFADLD